MSTTTPPRNGPISTPSDSPTIQLSSPAHGSGPPDVPPPVARRPWYRRGWVVGVVALLVGIGLGAAAGSTKKAPRAATVTAPAQTVVQTVAGPTKTRTVVHVQKVPGATKTVTVAAPTNPPASTGGSGGRSTQGTVTRTSGPSSSSRTRPSIGPVNAIRRMGSTCHPIPTQIVTARSIFSSPGRAAPLPWLPGPTPMSTRSGMASSAST